MSIFYLFGVLSVGWTAYELGRMSRDRSRVRAWTPKGRELKIEAVD